MSTKTSSKGNKAKASADSMPAVKTANGTTQRPNRRVWNSILLRIGSWKGHFALYLHYIKTSRVFEQKVWGSHDDFKSWYNAVRDNMPSESDSADMPSYDYATKYAKTAEIMMELGRTEKQIIDLRNFTNALTVRTSMNKDNIKALYDDVHRGLKTADIVAKYVEPSKDPKPPRKPRVLEGKEKPADVLKGIMKDKATSSVDNLWNLRISNMTENELQDLQDRIGKKLTAIRKGRKLDSKKPFVTRTKGGIELPEIDRNPRLAGKALK